MAQTAETDSWSRRRLMAIAAGLVLGQLAIIVWLSRGTPAPTPPKHLPLTYISSRSREIPPGVENPASFVLPDVSGFSGAAWLSVSNLDYEPPVWSDSAPPPKQSVFSPGDSLSDFLHSNNVDRVEFSAAPETLAGVPLPVDKIVDLAQRPAYLTVEGGLAGWPLSSQPALGEIHANDILKNSVVLAGVTPEGDVFSAVLVEKSGSTAADARALAAARLLRFTTPMSNFLIVNRENASQLRWGHLVFHWRTVALPVTNSIASP